MRELRFLDLVIAVLVICIGIVVFAPKYPQTQDYEYVVVSIPKHLLLIPEIFEADPNKATLKEDCLDYTLEESFLGDYPTAPPITIKATPPSYYVYYPEIPLSRELQEYTYNLSKEFDIDLLLVYAVMKLESRFENIISTDGNDFGLMQINKVNHKWLSDKLGIEDYLNPYDNILAGVYMLRDALNQGDNLHTSLMVYNCGIGRAQELWEEGIYSNTYSHVVVENYEEYLRILGE